jgi:hypothetical protein
MNQREQQVRVHVNRAGPLMDYYQQKARVNSFQVNRMSFLPESSLVLWTSTV